MVGDDVMDHCMLSVFSGIYKDERVGIGTQYDINMLLLEQSLMRYESKKTVQLRTEENFSMGIDSQHGHGNSNKLLDVVFRTFGHKHSDIETSTKTEGLYQPPGVYEVTFRPFGNGFDKGAVNEQAWFLFHT